MSYLKYAWKIFSSFGVTLLLLLLFAISSGVATFIENDFSTQTARASVYNTWWFELIMIALCVSLVSNIIKYKMYRKEKFVVFIFHISFVIILIGAGITRYIGYEGVMPIKEGKSSNYIISQDSYLRVDIKQINSQDIQSIEKKLLLSQISNNDFKESLLLGDIPVSVEYVEYIPKAIYKIQDDEDGVPIIELAIAVNKYSNNLVLKENESVRIGGDIISFNHNIDGYINFYRKDDKIYIKSKDDISTLKMAQNLSGFLDKDKLHLFESKMLHKMGVFNIVFKSFNQKGKITMSSSLDKRSDNEDALILKTIVNNKSHTSILFGKQGYTPTFEPIFNIDNVNITLSYGSRIISLPFSIHLKDFILDRYPGSNTPSSYKSEVVLIDEEQNITKDYAIFMNNILEHRGFRFYQSSYEPDESGTVLSVNRDYLGTLMTYIGYALLILGLVSTIFYRKSRFRVLYKKLSNKNLSIIFIFLCLASLDSNIYAKDDFDEDIQKMQAISEEHASKFGKLSIQSADGRMKPINTLSSQIIRKISGKNSISSIYPSLDLTSDQIFLGMLVFPEPWQKIKIIRIKSEAMKKELGFEPNIKYASFADFFDYKAIEPYKLAHSVEIASKTKPARRTTFDKEAIKLDEKVNILYMVYSGIALRVFPYPNKKDVSEDKLNQTWYSPVNAIENFPPDDSIFVKNILSKYFNDVASSIDVNDWSEADKTLEYIKTYQYKVSDLTLGDTKATAEIIYNKILIFDKLKVYYFIIGTILFLLVLYNILLNKGVKEKYIQIARMMIIFGFAMHTSALAFRWYLSGHAPWSNGYESVIYVAWAIVLAGILLSRTSFLALSASTIMASITLFVAHLSWLDPSITNLVPVLKSYWLTIHVSVITASYGFFALGFILGIINMLLTLFRLPSNKANVNSAIMDLSIINEMSLYLGLILITIGNFLGGIWANESWGRYWGWDAKETWALVSILIYAIVAHLRFVPFFKGTFTFNVASIIAFFSIIMTYFGVNFYLAGLHSYAAGDPIPIPAFLYYMVYGLFSLIILAYFKDKFDKKQE